MNFTFTPSKILPNVIIIEGKRHKDERGFFSETYRANEFEERGIGPFVQENHSRSNPDIFRGLHIQKNCSKLISCIKGKILDFAVDIRIGSPTYGKCAKIYLDADDFKMIYVPSGHLHGFLTFSGTDFIDVHYKVSEYYKVEHEQGVNIRDPDLKIIIPHYIELSEKDTQAPMLKDLENNFYY